MSATQLDRESGAGKWITAGLVAGLLAGIAFIVFELVLAAVLTPSVFGPLRLISAIVLGKEALPPPPVASLGTVIPVGLILHFVLSALWGVIFGAAAGLIGALSNSRGALIVTASVFGLALWLVNFYVIAPIVFPWFGMTNPVVQFFAHTFFFGTALGLILAGRVRREA